MLPDTPLMLTVLLLLVAFIVGARTALAWAALRELSAEVGARTAASDEWAASLPASIAQARARLATANGTIEHALWTLPRLDARLVTLSGGLRARRTELDELRTGPMAGARSGLARLRSTGRLILRLATLRRNLLG